MGRLAFVLLAVLVALRPPAHQEQDVSTSTDVEWLERLCSDLPFTESQFAARGSRIGSVRRTRSSAYLRLGSIGSRDSLQAIARIEKNALERSVLPGPVTPGRVVYHPALHMGDAVFSPAARLPLADNREAAIYLADWYGPPMPFLALRQADGWTLPSMVPVAVSPYGAVGVSMTQLPGDRLRIVFSGRTPDAIEVRIGEVTRDTDGDGWTDIAERWLGMSWSQADSDDDGIADGRDSAPLFGKPDYGEDEQILQRAVFAMFGLTASPGALHVADNSRRIHPFGLPGPLFYGERQGGVRVTWKIESKTDDGAIVEITDYEGALAASGNSITLKKIDGAWYATAIRMKWIS